MNPLNHGHGYHGIMCHGLSVLLIIFTSLIASVALAASFYGHSYIKLPFREYSNETKVEFRFKTYQPDGFLFLAAGSSDYCLLYLESGQLIVKINYGSGETYLSTDGPCLNDLQWHHIQLEKIETRLLLKVDDQRIYMNEINHLDGQKQQGNNVGIQLKILYGIFLGSLDTFKSLYLGDLRPFRGCLDQIYFNRKNILELAQNQQQQQAIFHEVSLERECDEEFDDYDALDHQTTIVSFVQHDSFVLLPGVQHYRRPSDDHDQDDHHHPDNDNSTTLWSNTTNIITVQFDLKTISQNALILFNPGKNPYRKEYLAMELIHNRLKVSINDGNVKNQVASPRPINDGQWHQVEMSMDPARGQLTIMVDGNRQSTSLVLKTPIELANETLIGGLSSTYQSLAINYGLESTLIEQNVSVKGCIKNVRINSRLVSLKEALATKRIKIGSCRWQFYCLDPVGSPCTSGSKCEQTEIARVKCSCSVPPAGGPEDCVRPSFKNKSTPTSLMVESAELLTDEVHGNAAEEETIIAPSAQQSSAMEISATEQQNSVHSIPTRTSQVHTIHIKMLANSKFTLTSNLFQTSGDDHHDDNNKAMSSTTTTNKNRKKHETIYKLIHNNRSEESFLENLMEPNLKLNSFTASQLRNGSIQFVHVRPIQDQGSSSSSKIDPIEMILYAYHGTGGGLIKEYRLIFKLYQIDINRLVNTGLFMAPRTFKLITSHNLSLLINNDDDETSDVDRSQLIRFSLIHEPNQGILQKLRSMPNGWVNVSQFNQRQIERGKIRYLHTGSAEDRGDPESDPAATAADILQLRILFNKQLLRNTDFRIEFVHHLELISLGSNLYNFSKNEKEFILTPAEIGFQTKPVWSDPRTLVYTLKSVPSYGTLYLFAANTVQKKLQIASNFTQKDIDERRILFVRNSSFVNIDSIRDLVDSFTFQVRLINSDVGKTSTFYIYFDDSTENYVLINRKLTVLEGDKTLIDENHLFLRSLSSSSLVEEDVVVFEIVKPPKYGQIQVVHDDQHVDHSPQRLPQKWIQQKQVYYQHDDSENNIDFFDFTIRNSITDDHDPMISGKFSIEILMKNDNPPVRRTKNRLNIIRNSEKILSNHDLHYVDDDLNTGQSNIVFSQIYCPNGGFYLTLNDSVAHAFTQQDINDGRVKFRHDGVDWAKTVFSVTDGQFILSDSLDVRASDPYIEVVNNTGIVLKYGETSVISWENLTIETNLPDLQEVHIKLITEPRFGQILINEKSTNHFTLKELMEDFVEYESTVFEDESPFSKNDSFEFRVFSNDPQYDQLVTESQEFLIRIYPLAYFHLNVVNLNNLTSFEDSQTLIDANVLLVQHSELPPEQIIYWITAGPQFGVIKNSDAHVLADNGTIQRFTQQDVNEGRIAYQTRKSHYNDFTMNQLDSFRFQVGNEIVRLTNLSIYIELIPNFITLITENLTVSEGSMAILTTQHIRLTHSYYEKFVNEFIVVEQPKYGTISLLSDGDIKLSAKSFTGEQLASGKVCYQHDSSEFDKDWFTVVARANSIGKESVPATVHITVMSINDEPPRIVNLTDVDVWQNEMVQITNRSLAAGDEDSKPNEIVFLVSNPINGYLWNSETNQTVNQFSQADIDEGVIYFVHVGDGGNVGSFRFHLTDGKNYGPSNILKIRVRSKSIQIIANEKLCVTPGSQQSITKHHLQVGHSGTGPETETEPEFIYRIIKAPTYGRIILEGFKQQLQQHQEEGGEEITWFTQQQLNENLVVYDQNVPIADSIVFDRIIFDVESPNVPTLQRVHFLVEIAGEMFKDSMKSSNIDTLISVQPLVVTEGKSSPITVDQMNFGEFFHKFDLDDGKVLLKVTHAPDHGLVLKHGKSVDGFQWFSPILVKNGSIVYMHDDSNTVVDSVGFSIYITDNFHIPIANITLPVRIIPVNDEYPQVITKNPRLRANFISETLITRETLNTVDNDGNDSKIIYMFHEDNFTQEGYLARDDLLARPIRQFTQQEINDNQIYFVHRGLKSDFRYWFRVKDDESIICDHADLPVEIRFEHLLRATMETSRSHCTDYYPFTVQVVPFMIRLINHTDVQLHQGSRRALISAANLAIYLENQEDLTKILYRIIRGPMNGYVLVENQRSLQFTQKQVSENQVYYIQDSLSHRDSFTVDIFQNEREKAIEDVEIKIIVVPLVKARKPFVTAYPGQKSLITLDHIDASELHSKTGSNPRFKIIKNPIYGTLNMLRFGGDELKSINEFTQEDIVQNRIIYQTSLNIEPGYSNEILIDVLEYELSALNVQNAHGVLVINIFNNQSNRPPDILMQDKYLNYLGITLLKEQFFLFFLILFLVLLIPTIIIVVRMCCTTWPKKANDCPKNYVAQTLATCHHPDHHSSTVSSRPNDSSSSHYSSSTTFDHSAVHSDVSNVTRSRFETINLNVLKDHPKKFLQEEMSPLPPPSLYFINDQTFDHDQWDKLDKSYPLEPPDTKQCLVETNDNVIDDNNMRSIMDDVQAITRRLPRQHRSHRSHSPCRIENGKSLSRKTLILDDQFFVNQNHSTTADNSSHPLTTDLHLQFKNQYWI